MKKFNTLALLIGFLSFASAHSGEDYYGHHGMMGSFGGWANPFFWIYQILFIVILVLVIVWLLKHIQKR